MEFPRYTALKKSGGDCIDPSINRLQGMPHDTCSTKSTHFNLHRAAGFPSSHELADWQTIKRIQCQVVVFSHSARCSDDSFAGFQDRHW